MRISAKNNNLMRYLPTILILFLLAAIPATAKVKGKDTVMAGSPPERGTVLVYQFRDNSPSRSYGYYSFILPESLSNDLGQTGKFRVKTQPAVLGFMEAPEGSAEFQNHLRYLAERGREFSADYIITGSYTVARKQIRLKVQIFYVREQRIASISETSDELGALLFSVIDKITARINNELDRYAKEKEAKVKEEQERLARSPYIPLYRSLEGIVFGVQYGRVKFNSEWDKIYDRTDLFSFFLLYDFNYAGHFAGSFLLKNSGVSLNLEALDTDPMKHHDSSLSIKALSVNYQFHYRFYGSFGLAAAAGGGLAKTVLIINDPMDQSGFSYIRREESRDPFLNLSLSLTCLLDPILLSAGYAHKRVLYSDTPLIINEIFTGIGFKL